MNRTVRQNNEACAALLAYWDIHSSPYQDLGCHMDPVLDKVEELHCFTNTISNRNCYADRVSLIAKVTRTEAFLMKWGGPEGKEDEEEVWGAI